jgi:hypothetical protein
MEHDGNFSARTSPNERASPSISAAREEPAPPPDDPQFASEAEEKAYWDGVTHGLRCLTGENRREDDESPAPCDSRGEAAEILDPCHRRPRQDGWLPWKKAGFLLVLVAGGVVADACRAVGMSVASAYALKNRRSGRAFGKMWDAVMIHRARARLADNNLSRAMDGWVDRIVKDGIVVAERRRFDNRLSMAMLTRLDRLAETKTGEEAELLRALSEDFEDYLDVVEAGGDEDAFVEERRPPPIEEQEGETDDRPAPWYEKDLLDQVAASSRTSGWRHVAPPNIPIDDLDPDRMDDWGIDGWIRAVRSYYLNWLELYRDSDEPRPHGADCPALYNRIRRDIIAVMAAEAEEGEEVEKLDSSPAFAGEGDQPKAGGGVLGTREEPFHRPAGGPPPREIPGRKEGEWQASTSSTSPGPPGAAGGGES